MENFFTSPGNFVLQTLLQHTPSVAAFLGISDPANSITLVIVLSAIIWVLGVTACWGAVMLVRNIYRISEAIIRTVWYRSRQAVGNIRTWLLCRCKSLVSKQPEPALHAESEVQFDHFDFTVLRAAAERGPGFSTSAPELASKYSLRPSQFERSLGKLSRNKMLATVIGSTDGFDNYRLTDYGAAYLQMWEQREAS